MLIGLALILGMFSRWALNSNTVNLRDCLHELSPKKRNCCSNRRQHVHFDHFSVFSAWFYERFAPPVHILWTLSKYPLLRFEPAIFWSRHIDRMLLSCFVCSCNHCSVACRRLRVNMAGCFLEPEGWNYFFFAVIKKPTSPSVCPNRSASSPF